MSQVLNILVIDDDSVDRMAVARSLYKTGIPLEITEESLATMGIDRLTSAEKNYDCVFLDYRLPDLDGLALIKALRRLGIMIPLIVLTGQGDEQIAVELMKAGASDYLSKSKISADALAQTLRSSLRIYQAEQQARQANDQLRATNQLLRHKNRELEVQRHQIEQQNQQLQETSRLKSQFLATISHELRTPMNAIMGFSQMLLNQYPDPLTLKQTDMVRRIYNNSQNLLNLLNEVLDFSKIEAGQLTLHPNEFDLVKLASFTVDELRCLAVDKALSLEMEIKMDNPLIISDQQCLRRILTNLLSNAIKFTDEGKISLKIQEKSEDRILIVLQDTGIGIAPDHLTFIFEAFRQIDQTLTRKQAGTGLGLAITDALVKLLQGTITVESHLGQGSTFKVEIPRQIAQSLINSPYHYE